jgi:MFS family permease
MMKHLPNTPFYPGWYQVGASVVGTGLSFVIIAILCFSIFVKPLQEEFGWTRGEISIALSITTLIQVVINPILGVYLDKWGVRRVLLPSLLLMPLVVGSAYYMNGSLWHFYLIYLLIPILGFGTGAMIWSRLLVSWFDRRRGMALGIGLSGIGLGAALMSTLLQSVIDSYGWREAYLVFAGCVFLIALPSAVFMVRNSPADAGLSPDTNEFSSPGVLEVGFLGDLTLSQVFRTRQYRLLMAAFMIFGMTVGGVLAHLFPIMLDQGLTTGQAAAGGSAMGMAIILGRIGCGYLMDKLYAPYVAAVFLSFPIASILLFAGGVNPQTAVLAAFLLGLGLGGEFDVVAFMVSRYFGLKDFGKLYGHVYAIFQLGHCIGPVAMGIAYDRTGQYTEMLWALLFLIVIGVICIACLGEYRKSKLVGVTA